ncbi:MAG: hypothetical protein ACE10G_08170, partial [Gemmatimonadales bacterium]
MPKAKKQSYEKKALKPFRKLLKKRGLTWHTGQSSDNQIAIDDAVGFQFGDLRVSADNCHVIVEVESAGGVTNLAKYWYCLTSGLITGNVYLLHLFLQDTPNSYRSHLLVWDLLRDRIEKEFP